MVGRRLICRIAAPPSGRRDSNPRPSPWQGDALPAEPRPHASPESPRAGPPDLSGVASELYPILAQPPTRNQSKAKKSVPRTVPADSTPSITPGQPPTPARSDRSHPRDARHAPTPRAPRTLLRGPRVAVPAAHPASREPQPAGGGLVAPTPPPLWPWGPQTRTRCGPGGHGPALYVRVGPRANNAMTAAAGPNRRPIRRERSQPGAGADAKAPGAQDGYRAGAPISSPATRASARGAEGDPMGRPPCGDLGEGPHVGDLGGGPHARDLGGGPGGGTARGNGRGDW